MAKITVSSEVSAPIERVFQVYTDLEKKMASIPNVTALKVLSDGPFGEGTRWRETRLMWKKEATEEMWVTGFDAPNRYNVVAESHGMRYLTLFEFVSEGKGTRVTWTFTGEALSFGAKLMAPIFNVLMKGTMTKCMRADLEALRDVCERDEG